MTTHSDLNNSVIEFNRSSLVSAVAIASSVLREHPILNPQFANVKKSLLAVNKASPLTLRTEHFDSADEHLGQPPKDRTIENFCLYMAAVDDDLDDHITPVSDFIRVTSQECLTVTRGWPLLIATKKIEYQYIKATSHTLNYLADDMLFAMFFSMALSKGLEASVATDSDVAPVAIPHANGLFLGTARKNTGEDKDNYGISYYRTAKVTRNKKPVETSTTDPDFNITSCINSFMPFREMGSDYRSLHTALYALRENRPFVESLASCFEALSRPTLYSTTELANRKADLKNVADYVSAVVNHSLWQDALVKRATPHYKAPYHHARAKYG